MECTLVSCSRMKRVAEGRKESQCIGWCSKQERGDFVIAEGADDRWEEIGLGEV